MFSIILLLAAATTIVVTTFGAENNNATQQAHPQQIASKPDVLKQCFESRAPLLNQFISCINSTAKTCFPTKNGPQVEYVSLQRVVASGEERMMAQASAFERAMGPANKPVVQTAEDLAKCMKECFLHKDAGQSCFNKFECQPKFTEDLVGPVLKRCAWRIGWKTEASQLCDCFLQAGVMSLKPYCQLLHGSSQGPKRTVQSTKGATRH
uniref:DB domain-containing protein n=1 Tax=Globodera pallida TaxID=36090 RepID=A0A183BZY5_GLOPA